MEEKIKKSPPGKRERTKRVTITLPPELWRQLLEELGLKREEIGKKNRKSLSGLIAKKLTYSYTHRPISEKNLTVIAKLKPGAGFAEVIKQLQVMDGALQVLHISGSFDFTGGHPDTIETVITHNVEI